MRRLLQSLIFNRRTYNRPQDEWTCGRACDGCPCVLGPDTNGQCRATGECVPAKRGDRWFCTRSEAFGGPCVSGPLPEGACGKQVTPCVPQRSLRAIRGRWVMLTAVAALGFVIFAFSGPNRSAWISPGTLTAHHAISAQRCADCHLETAAATLSPAALNARRLEENRLCLKCHELGPTSAAPHGTTFARPEKTPRPTTAAEPVALKLAHVVAPNRGETELACVTCHQEHHGRDASLTHLSNSQCQTCHAAPFESLAAGHPEFVNFPFTRRTRIDFDHASHLQKHFLEPAHAGTQVACARCHETAADGTKMLVRGFEQTCAECHDRQIEGEGRTADKGVPFLRLPGVDRAALAEAGESIGEWPAFSEGELTPFMRWLLEGNEQDRAALVTLGKTKLDDLSQASPAQKIAAARLVWSVKNIFADLVTQGQLTLLQRMNGPGAKPSGMAARTGQLSADGLMAAQQAWLPHLLEEVADYRQGKKPALPPPPVKPVVTTAPPAAVKPADKAGGDLLADDLLAPAPPPAAKPKPADDDLLAGPVPAAAAKPTDDLLADTPAAPAPAVKVAVAKPPVPPMKMADTEERAAAGGWYRRDETNTVYYRPVGHADPFLVAWIDASAGSSSPAAREIFADLTAPKAPGLCAKCHSIDETNGKTAMNWGGARPEPNQHAFTRFKHAAHFSVAGDRGCQTCHALDPKADFASGFSANRDPAKFHSNFASISRTTCANCHTEEVAGDSCLQCHNYHTGTFAEHMQTPPLAQALKR